MKAQAAVSCSNGTIKNTSMVKMNHQVVAFGFVLYVKHRLSRKSFYSKHSVCFHTLLVIPVVSISTKV